MEKGDISRLFPFFLLHLFRALSTLRKMSSLADYLRNLAERGVYDFEDIIKKYEAWVLDHRYMVMADC